MPELPVLRPFSLDTWTNSPTKSKLRVDGRRANGPTDSLRIAESSYCYAAATLTQPRSADAWNVEWLRKDVCCDSPPQSAIDPVASLSCVAFSPPLASPSKI